MYQSQFIEMLKGKAINGTISDLVTPKIANVKKTYSPDDTIQYIDISSINAEDHSVSQITEYSVKDAPSRAQQCVKYGDLLVSTVRPINRNIAIVDKDLDNLVASTGFCVLRPNDGMLNYLLSIILSDDYTYAMCDKANGGVYPAVNNGDVLNYQIHIPDEDLAKRASLVRHQADKSKFSCLKSQFIEMFGCKKPNAKVGDVSSVVSGKSISKDLEDIPGDIAYVKVADFNLPENNKYIQVSSRYVTSENANSSKLIPPGTIIFAKNGAASMSNKKRLTAIGCCIDMNTLAIIPNSQKVDSGFLYAIFDSLDLSFYVRQGAVPSISPHAIEGIEIYLPSFDEQLSFSKICKQADKSTFETEKSMLTSRFLKNSLFWR